MRWLAKAKNMSVTVKVENGQSNLKTPHFQRIPLVGINSLVETVVPPYVNFEEPTTCHSIVANSVNLSPNVEVRKNDRMN